MSKKLMIPLLAVLLLAVGAGAAYTMTKPKPVDKQKIKGTIYVMPKQFTLNLAGGQYATLTVALLLPPTQSLGVTSPDNPPPTGFGTLPEEAPVRAIITNDVTDQPQRALITAKGRHKLEGRILADINNHTDMKVTAIYFTDLAVQ